MGSPGSFDYKHELDAGLNPTHNRETNGTTIELNLEMDGYDITSISSFTIQKY